MDEWHQKLALELGGTAASPSTGASLDGATALEIAFGRARSVLAYALELALAHRIPATGSIGGDDITLRLGDARVRFAMNRRDGLVLVSRLDLDEVRARWDEANRAIVDAGSGAHVDLENVARGAVDAMVAGWRAHALAAQAISVQAPDREDEPTKG
jgi:hypothetical protein